MARILVIEDGPGVGRELASLLTAAGHRVLRCGGGPTPLAACPLVLPLRGRTYRGGHLLRAYRAHPRHGRLPLVLVTAGPAPEALEGSGPVETVTTFADPGAVLAAVHRLLHHPNPMPALSARPRSRRDRARR